MHIALSVYEYCENMCTTTHYRKKKDGYEKVYLPTFYF